MFGRIGRFAATHARSVLLVTLLVMVGAGALGFTAFGKLKTDGGFVDPDAESSKAQELVDQRFGGDSDVVFLVSPLSVRSTTSEPDADAESEPEPEPEPGAEPGAEPASTRTGPVSGAPSSTPPAGSSSPEERTRSRSG